jgi:3'-5' exoribonuclease
MLKQKELNNLAKGEVVSHFLVLKKSEIKTGKTNKSYWALELCDQSMSITANKWDNFDKMSKEVQAGAVVKVTGFMDDYMGTPQIRLTDIEPSKPSDNVTPEEFMPRSKRDSDVMQREFQNRIDRFSNPFLKKLIKLYFSEDKLEKYFKVPAGKAWHHSYIGGLIEHTLEIVKICDLMCDIHPELNRDLLICGALLHDAGKTEELSFDTTFDYTDKGRLIGHIVISAIDVSAKAGEIKDFPEELKNQLVHLVLSHQGKLEFASPVVPKTLEAVVLYHADELSAKANAFKGAIKAEAANGNRWTKYLPLVETALYIPEDFGAASDEHPGSLFD